MKTPFFDYNHFLYFFQRDLHAVPEISNNVFRVDALGLGGAGGVQPAGVNAGVVGPADVAVGPVTDHQGVLGGNAQGPERLVKNAEPGLGHPQFLGNHHAGDQVF